MSTRMIASTKVQHHFGQILDDVIQNNTRYVVKRRNIPQVIILSLSDFEQLLTNTQEQNKIGKVIRELRPEYSLGETIV